jgi:RNA polymerase sigma-B factor
VDTITPTAPRDENRHGRAREHAAFRSYARKRDEALRDRLVREWLPLANSMASRFAHNSYAEPDDLRQVATVGLIKAIDRFDPDRGTRFSTFAVPTIQGELLRYFRDFTWSVKPPRDLRDRAVRLERERERLTTELGRSPTAAELAARVGCDVEEVLEALEATQARRGDSLDRQVAPSTADDQGATLGELLGGDDEGYARADDGATLELLLARLPERQRLALLLRFRKDLTQAEIGERLGCSQMQVSRLLRRAVADLQAHVAEPRA